MDSRLLLLFSLLLSTHSGLTGNPSTPRTTTSIPYAINGGEEAREGDYPYQVAVMGTGLCGGAIITEDYILTAARCVSGVDLANIKIISGDKNLLTVGSYRSVTYATEVKIHENYNSFSFINDIAIVKIQNPFDLNSDVTSSIETNDPVKNGTNCILTGWGSMYEGKQIFFDGLQFANTTVQGNELCENSLGIRISDGQFCIGNSSSQLGHCLGDVGGPLVCGTKLTGISLGPVGCNDDNPQDPSVFTDVTFYKTWITEHTSSATTNIPCLTILSAVLFVIMK